MLSIFLFLNSHESPPLTRVTVSGFHPDATAMERSHVGARSLRGGECGDFGPIISNNNLIKVRSVHHSPDLIEEAGRVNDRSIIYPGVSSGTGNIARHRKHKTQP